MLLDIRSLSKPCTCCGGSGAWEHRLINLSNEESEKILLECSTKYKENIIQTSKLQYWLNKYFLCSK